MDVDGTSKVVKADQPEENKTNVAVFIGVMLSVIAMVAIGLAARQCFLKKEMEGDDKRISYGVKPMTEVPEYELKEKADYAAVNRHSIDLQPVYEH